MNRLKHVIPKKLFNSIYHTLFESHLSYGISVWGGVGNNKLEKLFILQKKCIRILFGDLEQYLAKSKTAARTRPYGQQLLGSEHYEKEHTKPLFNEQKIMSVHNLYHYHCCLEIFKIIKFRTPISLYDCLNISKRKPLLIIPPEPSSQFLYKATATSNLVTNKHKIKEFGDFSINTSNFKNKLKTILLIYQSMHDTNTWSTMNYSISS